MLFPAVYNDKSFFDDFDDAFGFPVLSRNSVFGKNASRVMCTDVRETATGYEYDIDLPGFRKEEISATLRDGYLVVSASKTVSKDEGQKEDGHYIRRERMSGSCTRSFYVGEAVKEEDVKAKYENGILSISIPKKEAVKPEHKVIMIS